MYSKGRLQKLLCQPLRKLRLLVERIELHCVLGFWRLDFLKTQEADHMDMESKLFNLFKDEFYYLDVPPLEVMKNSLKQGRKTAEMQA